MNRCKRCIMPNTRPNIQFKDGVCMPCLIFEKRAKTDWDKKWEELEEICEKYRKEGKYDCLVTISGGKDSHYQVGLLKERLGMNPLGFMVDNGSWTQTGRDNFYNLSKEFGIDILTFTIDCKEVITHTKEDFIKEGHPAKYWDSFLYLIPMEFAHKFGIKLVVWGENVGEFIGGKNPVPTNFLGIEVLFLSDYVNWSRFKNVEYSRKHGFKTLEDSKEWDRWGMTLFPYEQVDTIGYLVNDYMKFIKFGFRVHTEICSDMIRHGLMGREEGLKYIRENEWKLDLKMEKDFCNAIGITSKEFWNIIDSHANTDLLVRKRNSRLWVLKNELSGI